MGQANTTLVFHHYYGGASGPPVLAVRNPGSPRRSLPPPPLGAAPASHGRPPLRTARGRGRTFYYNKVVKY
jgi:hypothetical protein